MAPTPFMRCRHVLAIVGRLARGRAAFVLMLAALAWGVLLEARRPRSWRRPVRGEFRRALRQSAGGGLAAAFVTAALAGLALVAQVIYWLGLAGQQELEGAVLVTVLVRELTPLLIGMLLLGRSGTVTVAELGLLQLGGQVRVLIAQGIDPVLLLVMPRAIAYALASFTLGVLFGGAVVIETVFTLPGVGRLLITAVVRRDYPVVEGTMLLVAGWYVLVNFVVDLLYTVSDPRIRMHT